jgi:hypothetical protein
MADRFEPLDDDATYMRVATTGSRFLPQGHVLPDPQWLRPTSADEREAAERGRVPGLSGWELGLTTPEQAAELSDQPGGRVFGVKAGALRRTALEKDIPIDVLHDPADVLAPRPGWDGHAIMEGLARPERAEDRPPALAELTKRQVKGRYLALLQALVGGFESLS